MKEDLKIQNLTKNEVEQSVMLLRKSFDDRYLVPSIYRGQGVKYFIQSELSSPFPNSYFFSIKNGENLLGTAEFKPFDNVIFLNMICVESSKKGTGLGTYFLLNLMRDFKKKAYKEMQLDVFESNETALRWYLKNGFEVVSLKYLYVSDKLKLEDVDFRLLNYPQVEHETDKFGFSVIKLVDVEGTPYEVGVISNDLIIRSPVSQKIIAIGNSLIKSLNGDKLYFFDSDSRSQHLGTRLETLLRLKITL
jgi:GNAT superfamily N-acetyltransferase